MRFAANVPYLTILAYWRIRMKVRWDRTTTLHPHRVQNFLIWKCRFSNFSYKWTLETHSPSIHIILFRRKKFFFAGGTQSPWDRVPPAVWRCRSDHEASFLENLDNYLKRYIHITRYWTFWKFNKGFSLIIWQQIHHVVRNQKNPPFSTFLKNLKTKKFGNAPTQCSRFRKKSMVSEHYLREKKISENLQIFQTFSDFLRFSYFPYQIIDFLIIFFLPLRNLKIIPISCGLMIFPEHISWNTIHQYSRIWKNQRNCLIIRCPKSGLKIFISQKIIWIFLNRASEKRWCSVLQKPEK